MHAVFDSGKAMLPVRHLQLLYGIEVSTRNPRRVMDGDPNDVIVKRNPPDKALVVCLRCDEEIGRLQTTPTTPSVEETQTDAEIRLIAEEHRPLCPAR